MTSRQHLRSRLRLLQRTFMDMRLRDADRAIEEIKRLQAELGVPPDLSAKRKKR